MSSTIDSHVRGADPRRYLQMYRHYVGRRIYFVFFLACTVALLEGLGITLILPLLTTLEADGDPGGKSQVLFRALKSIGITSTGKMLLFISAVFFIKGAVRFFEGAYRARLQGRLMRELKGRIFEGFEKMDYRYYQSRNTGHFINVINEQANQFCGSFREYTTLFAGVITTLIYFVIAIIITWQFALMGFLMGLVVLGVLRGLNRLVKTLSRKSAHESGELNKFLVQTLHGFKYAISTGQLAYIKTSVIKSISRLADYLARTQTVVAFSEAIREPVAVAMLMTILTVQVVAFDTPLGHIAVSLILFYRGMQSMMDFQGLWQKVAGKAGSIEMVADELAILNKVKAPDGLIEVPPLTSGIVLHDLSYSYDGRREVLRNISLTIRANSTIALVGESGSGKSTLADLLTILLRPTKGDILVDGRSVFDIKLDSWRRQIGYVSQETVMFDDTLANNIGLWTGDYGSDAEYRKRILEASRQARADVFIKDLKDGFQTPIGDRGIRLSGGQRQRLFVARELFKNPRLLILDEATSALDSESERYIQEAISALKGSMTVIIIAHRLSTVRNADVIYVLEKGEIIESGSYHELRESKTSRFREMIEIQGL